MTTQERKQVKLDEDPRYRDILINERESLIKMRELTLKVLLIIFSIGNIACIALYFLNGFGLTNLSDTAMGSLAAATIAEVAGLSVVVVKFLFPREVH